MNNILIKDKLKNLKHLEKEIELIKKEIENIYDEYVIDSVTGSSPEYPYTSYRVQIEGFDVEKESKLKKRLRKTIEKLEAEKLEALEFIYNIEDSVTRQIFILKYIQGFNWEDIAYKMNYGKTSIRDRHRKYLNSKYPTPTDTKKEL